MKLPEGAKYHFQMQYGSIGWATGATLGVALAVGKKDCSIVKTNIRLLFVRVSEFHSRVNRTPTMESDR